MGDYTKLISKRIRHVGLKSGFCLICGEYGKLSQDHVPPTCCVTVQDVEQKLVTELTGLDAVEFLGVKARNGSSFRTICQVCNNKLGLSDNVVGEAYKKLTRQVVLYFNSPRSLYHFASTPVNAIAYARSLIGHMLAATSAEECRSASVVSDYFDPLKRFVLGDNSAIDETHDIYYWFYPRDMHISAKFVSMINKGHISTVSVLSFFPVAFMVTRKGEGTYPAQAIQLKLTDTKLIINLSSANLEFSSFPFVPLEGDQMYALRDGQAVVSYPVGK